MISTVGVPVEEDFDDIGMKAKKLVIHMECDAETSWVRSLGESWPTQIMDQWVYWIPITSSGDDVTNINLLIAVLPGTNKNY